jgi:hypothetical protein
MVVPSAGSVLSKGMPTGVCAVAVVLTATAIAATRTSLVMNILWALPYLNSMHEKAWSSLTTVKSGKLSMVRDIAGGWLGGMTICAPTGR